MKTKLFWHKYKYFKYEKDLAIREVESKLNKPSITYNKDFIEVEGNFKINDLKDLVYFASFEYKDKSNPTLQYYLENFTNSSRQINSKQSTRYLVHGLHEYKGKFNPQVVRSLLNIFCKKKKTLILDPFCGSGTTLIECLFGNYNSVGFDLNPLAIFITKAKYYSLIYDFETIKAFGDKLLEKWFINIKTNNYVKDLNNYRIKYLKKWFPEQYLNEIESLFFSIKEMTSNKPQIYRNISMIFLIIGSNLLRDYSNQEPADLRIRIRRTPFPENSYFDKYKISYEKYLKKFYNLNDEFLLKNSIKLDAYTSDVSNKDNLKSFFKKEGVVDCIVTSPPYATALPYIDTQRLSLVWLGLLGPKDIRVIEEELIGSREYIYKNNIIWNERFINNSNSLSNEVYDFCLDLKNSIGKHDGFRRQAIPSLLYRYFSKMKLSFENLLPYLKADSNFLLIVGENHTILNGNRKIVDTPYLLSNLAENIGWKCLEISPLETYKRYDLHSKNSIKYESLIVLRK